MQSEFRGRIGVVVVVVDKVSKGGGEEGSVQLLTPPTEMRLYGNRQIIGMN